jgi:parallel beta-helix repeat protein
LEPLEDRTTPSTFTVTSKLDVVDPADGKLSLREAITAANGHAGADVIVVPAGVYKIALAGAGESGNATGDFDITDAVTIAGAGAGATIVDAQQKDRVFEVSGSGPVVIAGLTIRNGLVTGGPGDGGGIRAVFADLVVRDCAVVGNRASGFGGGISNDSLTGTGNVKVVRTTVARNVSGMDGGGIFLHNSVLTVTNSTIRLNVAGGGGGIDATTATLTNSTVSGNTAGGSGGGLSAEIATLTNSTISGNSSQGSGGGIRIKFSNTATLTNCTISGNFAAGDGGGIWGSNTTTLTNCTMSGNASSQRGGGINVTTANLTNCTVSGNSAVIEGGGVYSTSANMLNCTVVENVAGTGGGLFHVTGGMFSVRNTIVALNLVPFGNNGPDAFGAGFTSQGHNLIGDGTGTFNQGANGDIVGTSANPIDPKLGPLQNNGGPTKTMALLTGSLAIDAGDNSILPATDQRGFARKKDGNFDGIAIVDIGAFEK